LKKNFLDQTRHAALKLFLTNKDIAELLALEADKAEGIRRKAFAAAARASFRWPQEAAAVVAAGKPLTELDKIGPHLARRIGEWLERPPDIPAPPPIRSDFLTLAEARSLLSKKRATLKLRGDLQMHTTWSDGSGTLAEMAAAAENRGYSYIAITDHSKGLKIANGLNEERLREQQEEITRANESSSVRVLRSIEMNLKPTGEGDMEPQSLAQLDLVLGSFHSQLRISEDQTARYLAALRNPSIDILGHPRGRIYNFRLGLSADWSRVFGEAAKLGKAVEIDSYPDRQDLNVDLLKIAKRAGTLISIGTDAHHTWQLGFIDVGIVAAIKAGIPRDRILNLMPLRDLLAWVKRRRSRT
jgi:histidinol phosphatase-like PHP family hydrolase